MPNKDEEAKELADKHYLIETGMIRIFRVTASNELEGSPKEPIKLLEVNENTVPAGIMPIHFGPSPASGRNYSTIIMEVTPEEFGKIQARELALPHGWKIGELLPRPAEVEIL